MREMRMTRFIALFMTSLIMMLPVAVAQDLSIVKFQGMDGVDGYARSNDDVTIEVLASLAGLPVNESRVRLYLGSNFDLFQSCVKESGEFYRCSYAGPMTWYGTFDFDVKLTDYSQPPKIVASKSKSIVIDEIAPVVKTFSASTRTTSGPVTFDFGVEDYATSYGDTSVCSGIKKVNITTGEQDLVTDYSNSGVCLKTDDIAFTFQTAGEETYSVCAIAEDYLGHKSIPSCVEVVVDNSAPNISDFTILDPDLFDITHVRTGEDRLADVVVRVQDEGGVNPSSVKGNFNELNSAYSNFFGPDRVIQNEFFVWEGIRVKEVSNCEVIIKAEDDMGNQAQRTFPCDIKADDISPTPINYSGPGVRDGRILIGYNAPLTVLFEDKDSDGNQGVGFQSKKAYIDMRDMGLSDSEQPDSCTFNSPYWECVWNIAPASYLASGDYNLYLTTDTRDDLNNAIGSDLTIPITYDTDGPATPEIVSFNVVSNTDRGVPVRGDTVVYEVKSKDFVNSYANFSVIGGEEKTQPLGCTPDNNDYICTYQSFIFNSGPYSGNVEFSFFDDAGNKNSVSTSLTVYELLSDFNPDYWSHSITCTPSGTAGADIPLVDRFLNPQVGQFFSCNVNLIPNHPGSNLTTVSIEGPDSLQDCVADNIAFYDDVTVINTFEGSAEPIMLFTMAPTELTSDHSVIECPLYITSASNGAITPHAESEMVEINVSFFGEPYGDAYAALEDTIENQFDTVDEMNEWLGVMNDVVSTAEDICYLKGVLANILGVVEGVGILIGTTESVVEKIPVVGGLVKPSIMPSRIAACGAAEDFASTYEGTVADFLDKACAMVNCQGVTGKSWEGLGFVGGGLPWCTAYEDWMQDSLGLTATETEGEQGWEGVNVGRMLPVQDSLVLSTACFCLPGIVRNLDKLRQNECKRAVCLANDYVTQGVQLSSCNKNYHYTTCAFIMGEVFNVIPFSNFFDMISDQLGEWIANPWSVVPTLIGAGCKAACSSPDSTVPTVCMIARTASLLGEATASIVAMVEAEDVFGGTVRNDWCEEYEKVKEEWDAE